MCLKLDDEYGGRVLGPGRLFVSVGIRDPHKAEADIWRNSSYLHISFVNISRGELPEVFAVIVSANATLSTAENRSFASLSQISHYLCCVKSGINMENFNSSLF